MLAKGGSTGELTTRMGATLSSRLSPWCRLRRLRVAAGVTLVRSRKTVSGVAAAAVAAFAAADLGLRDTSSIIAPAAGASWCGKTHFITFVANSFPVGRAWSVVVIGTCFAFVALTLEVILA